MTTIPSEAGARTSDSKRLPFITSCCESSGGHERSCESYDVEKDLQRGQLSAALQENGSFNSCIAVNKRGAISFVAHHREKMPARRIANDQHPIPVSRSRAGFADKNQPDIAIIDDVRLTDGADGDAECLFVQGIGFASRACRLPAVFGIDGPILNFSRLTIVTGPSGPSSRNWRT